MLVFLGTACSSVLLLCSFVSVFWSWFLGDFVKFSVVVVGAGVRVKVFPNADENMWL